MRKISALAALCAFSLTAGCAQLQNLLTPSNIQAATNLLKDIGVELKFTDALGQVQAVDSEDDVQEITLEGRKLEKGKDYKFEGGKMVFVGLSPDQQKKVNIKLTNGTEFKDFAIDPTKATNAGCFNFDANGALNKVDQGASKCEDALKQHQDAHKNSRLEFQTGLAYTKDQFKGLGFKPYGSQDTFALPQVAYAGIEGGGKFEADVRVLNGGPQGNEDLSKRTWVALWIKDGKFLVAKFNIKKSKADTLQKAPNPEPGKPFDPTKLPPRQTIAVGDIENLATKSYDTEAAAKTGENLKEPPKPGDQPNMPPPPQS